jgi:hypothetical protein
VNQKLIANLVCPLVGGRPLDEHTTALKCIYGTAFPIGGPHFLTARHCVPDPAPDLVYGIGYPAPEKHGLGIVRVVSAEPFDQHDMALLVAGAPVPHVEVQKWSLPVATALADVWATGYPHALDIADMGFIAQRAFKGHIVSHVPHQRIGEGKFIDVYELSFMVPKGLSGAPLFLQGDAPLVAGLMLGMRQTDMEVLREVEATDDKKTVEIVYYVQRMHYGMAITSATIADIHSGTLGKKIGAYLQENGLVAG